MTLKPGSKLLFSYSFSSFLDHWNPDNILLYLLGFESETLLGLLGLACSSL